jgi:plasmid stabilization system protein ParE
MNARFRFTPEAEAQLTEIIDYIAADSEDAARRVLNGVHGALEKLAEMPQMFRRPVAHPPTNTSSSSSGLSRSTARSRRARFGSFIGLPSDPNAQVLFRHGPLACPTISQRIDERQELIEC